MGKFKRILVGIVTGTVDHFLDEKLNGPYHSPERIAKREAEARRQELMREYLQDIHQIGLVAEKRKIRAKKSFYGVTLVIGPGGAKLYKGGMLLNEEQEMQLPTITVSRLRTHFNHLVVPA